MLRLQKQHYEWHQFRWEAIDSKIASRKYSDSYLTCLVGTANFWKKSLESRSEEEAMKNMKKVSNSLSRRYPLRQPSAQRRGRQDASCLNTFLPAADKKAKNDGFQQKGKCGILEPILTFVHRHTFSSNRFLDTQDRLTASEFFEYNFQTLQTVNFGRN